MSEATEETQEDCYHCGWDEANCKCDELEPNFCKYCGREFKGKFYFSWCFHQAVCGYEKRQKGEGNVERN